MLDCGAEEVYRYSMKSDSGFTLLELAIVFVIIGLLIGGIFIGRDLIDAARLRSTITQYQAFSTAASTFAGKYNGLPGDIKPSTASLFGLFAFTTSDEGFGNGDDLITGTFGILNLSGETLAFWRHLSEAGFISGTFGPHLVAATGAVGLAAETNMETVYPQAKLGRDTYFLVYGSGVRNYFQILAPTLVDTDGAWVFADKVMTPTEAHVIDAKLDDGNPATGAILARSSAALGLDLPPSWAASASRNACTFGGNSESDPASRYNIEPSTGGIDPSCSIRLPLN